MQRLGLEEIVTLARSLVSIPYEEQERFCLELFSAAHVHHKIAKRLGGRKAREYQPVLPPAPSACNMSRDVVSGLSAEFCSVFSALRVWRSLQAQRGGVPNR